MTSPLPSDPAVPPGGNASGDTIAAIASAPGMAGVGVVRVSGPLTPSIALTLLGRAPRARHAHLASFKNHDGSLIDRGLLLYFPAPASYTGEAVLELQGHGSPVLLDALLRRCCALGARLAHPGEFTERAFLNGRMDLAQAEAVADLIAARSQSGARAAMQSMEGVFSRRVEALLHALIALRIHIEAAIDFPEEEIDFLADPAIGRQLDEVRRELTELMRATQRGVRLNDGLRVVIAGRPNAGKSSLLNALAGSERAIVSATAGTTRDVLREQLSLDGVVLELADTAGLRDSNDDVEREGIRRAYGELQRADVAVLVTDAQQVEQDLGLLTGLPVAVERIVLVNKIDRDVAEPRSELRAGVRWLWASAKTGAGLDALRETLKLLAGAGGGEGAFSARRRHVLALEQVDVHLTSAAMQLGERRAGELAADDLKQAQLALGEITGMYSSDDLLGAIFGSFCIGK